MEQEEVRKLELDLLVEAIHRRYGYDFRHYSMASFARRLDGFLATSAHKNLSEILSRILYDEAFFYDFLSQILVSVTEFFRDPKFYQEFTKTVIPILSTYPYIKIWHAGCASGEEVYSMAILLKEAGLLHKSMLYGTDINRDCLLRAEKGVYPLQEMHAAAEKYIASGGCSSLCGHYLHKYGLAKFHKEIRKNLVFSTHNLATDGVFGAMHVIICKNVFIYFDKSLQEKAMRLFVASLSSKGFLCLGPKESLSQLSSHQLFEPLSKTDKIYRML